VGPAPIHIDVREGLSPAILDAIRSESMALIDACGAPEEAKYAASVIIEELSTNILEHSGAEWLELEISGLGGALAIGIRDNGMAFDPTEFFLEDHGDPDLTAFTNRQLGIYMVRRLAHSLSYQREAAGLNRLTLELGREQA
jgi:anti-sigma regulatory factor (Ser/Thr protein kinase)